MKRTTLAAALVLASTGVSAFDLPFQPDDWTTEDTRRQIAYTAIAVIDAGQTADIHNHANIRERNFLTRRVLGEQPDTGATAAYFAGVIVANYAVAAILPPKYRRVFQYASITFGGSVTASNYSLGLRWGF